nr:error-prone DNA polymerase [uncultured Rhodopila sp.]
MGYGPRPMYTELQVTTNYSFLRGASHVEELMARAAVLRMPALGIADRNSLAGIVRAHQRAKEAGIRLIAGCRLDLTDGPSVLVYPADRLAWSRLTRLLTLGKSRAGKGKCELYWSDLAASAEGLVAVLCTDPTEANIRRLKADFGDRAYVALTLMHRPNDAVRLRMIADTAQALEVPTVATNDVLYHAPGRRILQDVLTCIRAGCSIDELGYRRERSAVRHLEAPEEMARLFARHPDAVAHTGEIADRCRFSLDELRYQYPHEVHIPGLDAQQTLARRTWEGAAMRYPNGIPDDVLRQLHHELDLIASLDYAPYFLTVDSIVRFARANHILCQGRGSAANSAVCFVLGITSIDPTRSGLLFERFVSAERREPPDIDVDFEHERREEVIQWVYDTYGRSRAALCATIIRYRGRGAVRDVGKAMGLTEDVTAALASQVWSWSEEGVAEEHAAALNFNLEDRRLRLTLDLARALIGFPRHMSQHPGGFVLTQDRLDDLVPIEPAAMVNRQVIEWDKDDIDVLRFMKVDVLGLGMLGCMRRAFDLLADHKGQRLDLATIPPEDPATYAMIRKADTLGTFQIESRAQMSMLPRLKPRTFYDIVIQVAIVRPGPIQGDMVHPYLRRREGLEKVEYPTPELRRVLEKTLGVPLFQEQAMQVAIVCAGFTPSEADALRRSMATFKFTGGVSHFKTKLIAGMVERGYTEVFAEKTFSQIEGFGSYGFPESHAASFALIAYASAWLKCHHPDVFCCALLNAQPMGFYATAQIVRDAQLHGVEVRPVSVNESAWDCTLERLGQRVICANISDGGPDTVPVSWPGLSRPSTTYGAGRGKVVDGRTKSGHDTTTTAAAGPAKLAPIGHRPLIPVMVGEGPPSTPSPAQAQGVDAGLRRHDDGGDHDDGDRYAVRLGLRMVKGLSATHADEMIARRGAGYRSIEDMWRRSRVPVASLERLAEADAFQTLGLDRRQALWTIRGLSDTRLPLFDSLPAEPDREPAIALAAMTAGRQVVEDYRSTGLSLRRHPVSFLRQDLAARRIVRCSDLLTIRDGKRVEVAGIILVRQRPGSARGVLFVTVEDETGHANLILWPSVFEAQRRLVLSASMIACRGKLQREGEVLHVIAEHLTDLSDLLRGVGERDEAFPLVHGRGDEAKHGGAPDPREKKPMPASRDIYVRDLRPGIPKGIKVPTRDFR